MNGLVLVVSIQAGFVNMFANILIIVFSIALLGYWFRYSCLLLIRNQSEAATPSAPSVDNRFHIAEIQESLRRGLEMDPLHNSLQRDYQVLAYLLRHAAGLELNSFEDRLLVVDYRVMRCWYSLTRTAAPEQARQALSEMAQVLGILASRIGERAGVQNEA